MAQMQEDAATVSGQIRRWSAKMDEQPANTGKASTGPDVAPMVGDCVARCIPGGIATNSFREIQELRSNVIREAAACRHDQCFTADPGALHSYLEVKLAGRRQARLSDGELKAIAGEALRLKLVMSISAQSAAARYAGR